MLKSGARVRAAAVVALGAVLVASAARAQGVAGRIQSVTLYRGQALVARAVPVEGPAGPLEVVVNGLPEQVVPDSLFAEGGASVEVRAVRFRARAVGEEPRDEVRAIDKEMEGVQAKLERNQKLADVLAHRLAYLDKMENFVAPTASTELSKGVLNADTLQKMAVFSFEQRKAAAEDALKLAAEQADLQKQVQLLQRKREELAAGTGKTLREAVLFVDKKGADRTEIRLSYLARGAGWSPAYNFYAESGAKEIRLEYNALIQQQTGEDWSGVSLTISTAFPALSAEAPGLAPFRVALGAPPPQSQASSPVKQGYFFQSMSQEDLAGNIQINTNKLSSAYNQAANVTERGQNLQFNWEMNDAAGNIQALELTNPHDILQRVFREGSQANEGVAVSYALKVPVALASRSDQQLVRIVETRMPCKFFHLATPILTPYVYRQAEITHNGADALLGGPCSVYLDGRFVGRGVVPSVGRGETFVIGFGADSQLRARRELADKMESVQGGNREIKFQYRLVLENYKEASVTVRVMDRLPVAENETDIRVTLGDLKEKLSDDPVYLRLERPKGILRWDIEVPAGASGEKPRIVDYGYRVEFDRKLSLVPSGRAKDMLLEFRELQEKRSKK